MMVSPGLQRTMLLWTTHRGECSNCLVGVGWAWAVMWVWDGHVGMGGHVGARVILDGKFV